MNSDKKKYGFFELVRNNQVICSSAGPKILAFGSHSLAKFQPMLDCFIPNFKLKYEDSENIKADRVNTMAFNLYQIKLRAFFRTPNRCKMDTCDLS